MSWPELLTEAHLAPRLGQVQAALGVSTGMGADRVDLKVAASALQIGLASRLWSVGLAGAVVDSWVPDLRPSNLLGSPGRRGPVPLALRDGGAGAAAPDLGRAAELLAGPSAADGSLSALEAACARVGGVSRQVLRSNAASSLVGAARVLSAARPPAAGRAWALVRLLLANPAIGGGHIVPRAHLPHGVGGSMERPDEAFLRTGCCLFDRIPGHGLCPDCVRARHRPERVTQSH